MESAVSFGISGRSLANASENGKRPENKAERPTVEPTTILPFG